jgi:methionyl-tRNA formyltransferase
VRRFSQVAGDIGAVTAIGETSLHITAHGGQIEVFKVRYEGGEKMAAAEFCAAMGLGVGAVLGA